MHGERAGFNNTAWDAKFLDLIEKDPVRVTGMTQAELAELGGLEGAEIIMWLIMRGALSAQVKKVHQTYYLPSMTGIATAIYENEASAPLAGEVARHRARMAEQLLGAERLRECRSRVQGRPQKAGGPPVGPGGRWFRPQCCGQFPQRAARSPSADGPRFPNS